MTLKPEEEIRKELTKMKRVYEDLLDYDGVVPMPKIGGTPEYWANRCDAKIQFARWVLNEEK